MELSRNHERINRYALSLFYRKTRWTSRHFNKNVDQNEKNTSIMIELRKKPHLCLCCKTITSTVHDYRKQVIKDIPAFGKQIILILRKRRYLCPESNKRFLEQNHWLSRYHRMTNRLAAYVIEKCSDVSSFTSIAREVNLSVSTDIRIFDIVGTPKVSMPKVLSIDELKGNTSGQKYQCIITDPVNKRILDILPMRYKHSLADYFRRFDRTKTTHLISDMFGTYRDISKTFFKTALLPWTNIILCDR